MKPTTPLRSAAYTVGLLLYGPLIAGLSIWGITWSGQQHKSAFVLAVLVISLVFFVVGCIIVALTGWLWYEILAEERRIKQEKNDQSSETLAVTSDVST
jgi:hypothetical protein